MPDRRRLALVVGLFILLSLVVGGIALTTLGQRSGILRPRYALVTYFENAQGLVAGGPVRLAGKDVGRVRTVAFAPLDGEVPPVRVELEVDATVRDRIRSDSVASIGTIGLLGDRYVAITMGTPDGRVLAPGDELASVSPVDLEVALVRGTQAIDSVATLAENVNLVVEDFRRAFGEGRLTETTESVASMTTSLAELVEEVRTGEGLLHGLVYDAYEGGGVQSIERSLARLEQILEEVATGDGLLHQVIYEAPDADVWAETLGALERINDILAKVDGGHGTLGLLVNDPSLYHDLEVLLGGARRSLLVRSLVRLSTSDGGEER